jgi:hypothetical protein
LFLLLLLQAFGCGRGKLLKDGLRNKLLFRVFAFLKYLFRPVSLTRRCCLMVGGPEIGGELIRPDRDGGFPAKASITANALDETVAQKLRSMATYLQIPVENEVAVKNAVSLLAGLFKGFSGK